jgi:hypothetical protein
MVLKSIMFVRVVTADKRRFLVPAEPEMTLQAFKHQVYLASTAGNGAQRKEYGGFVVETVLPAVALNIASLGLDVEQLLDWLDKQNAIIPHTIVGKASDHQQSTYAIAIGGKASDPVTYGHVSPWYQQHLHAIAIGNWSKSNIPVGYLPKKMFGAGNRASTVVGTPCSVACGLLSNIMNFCKMHFEQHVFTLSD